MLNHDIFFVCFYFKCCTSYTNWLNKASKISPPGTSSSDGRFGVGMDLGAGLGDDCDTWVVWLGGVGTELDNFCTA